MNYGARFVSTGLGIPSRLVTNDDLAKIMDTSDEWIRTRTGIRERRYLDNENGEYLSTICLTAAKQALEKAKLKATDIDLIVFATITADTVMPNNSARMLGLLGIENAAGFDVSAACGGYVVGLHTVNALIRSGMHKRVMLFAADALSIAVDMKDRSTCVLFGDGGGCAILERFENPDPSKDSMVLGTKIYTEFDTNLSLAVLGSGSFTPAWNTEKLKQYPPFIKMNGQEVFKRAVKGMLKVATELLAEQKISTSQIDWFVPHQANLRIIEATAKYLDFPMEKVFVNIDRWANTSAGTVAIALAEMEDQGLLKKGDLILTDVFGGGFNYGAALIRW